MEGKEKKILIYSLSTLVIIGLSYYLYNEYKLVKSGVTAENKQNKVVINKI